MTLYHIINCFFLNNIFVPFDYYCLKVEICGVYEVKSANKELYMIRSTVQFNVSNSFSVFISKSGIVF